MCLLRLFAAVVGLCACARIRQDAKLKLLQGGSSKSGDCPTPVQEFEDLSCRDAEGERVDFYCCNTLKSCRHESTALLAYSLEWISTYERECGVLFSDFDYAADMQSLMYVGDEEKLCAAGCQTSRLLSEKPTFRHTAAGLQEMCDGKVVPDVWEPQLDSARWPMNKVDLLDELWQECDSRSPGDPNGPGKPGPGPTPAPLPTTTTTTRTMSLHAPVNAGVDFSFMTGDLTPVRANKGILHWLNKVTLKRRMRNTSAVEEIAGGHTCRTVGIPTATYFASSLCYWLPDIKREIAQDHVGLDWNGGQAGFGQPLCENILSGTGQCLKCSVCHDNAMNEEGEVWFTSFTEEIALPSCKMESEIEIICVGNFHEHNRPLKDENDRCGGLKDSFENAVSRHEQAEALVRELTSSVEIELPAKITDKEAAIAAQQARKTAAQATEQTERGQVTSDCYNYASVNGWPFWYYRVDVESFPTGELIDLMRVIVCVHPGLGNPMGPYHDCMTCKNRFDAMEGAFDEFEDAEGLREEYRRHLDDLEATLERKTTELAHWNEQEPILEEVKREKTAAWEPEMEYCEEKFVEYQEGKKEFVITCALDYYDDSCEKACIEIQSRRPEGCGVMEGSMPLAPTGRGGLRNSCRPPQHSWIHGPWNYGAPVEDAFDQCSRVWSLQEPSYAQDTKKAGSLLKAGRFGGWWFGLRKYTWNKRYFVLESGDAVRSGILRYFVSDPLTHVRAEERYNKFIILWDAKGIDTKPGSAYRRSDAACFELEHFYRTYVFCVEDGDTVTERNEWVSAINPEIRFPS